MCCSNSGYYVSPSNYGYSTPYHSYNCYYTPNYGGYHNGSFYNGGMNDCGISSLSLIALFALLCR